MSARTCDQLGLCQQRAPACQGCTACPPIQTETGAAESDVWGEIHYWGAVVIVTALTVVSILGCAGYIVGRLT